MQKKTKAKIKAYYKHTQGVMSTIIYFIIYYGFLQIYIDNQFNTYEKGIAFIGMIISAFFCLRGVKRLLQKKYKEAFKKFDDSVEKLKDLLKRLAKKLASKLGLRRNRVFIKGKDKVEFVFGELKRKNAKEKEKKKRQKLPKWADLTTNRERVRYIYAAFLSRRKRYGYSIDSAMTPTDISKVYAENDLQRRLFECYNEVRYDDDIVPVSGSVVKELLPIIKKS